MSAALTEAIESLHIAAAKKLLELIQTEKDPSLLARLIATAFRFKLGKPAASNAPPRPPRTPNPSVESDEDALDEPVCETPPPYTDQQFMDLVRQYGPAEADAIRHRRFALIDHLTRCRRGTTNSS